jgi:NAD(P)-dependent dehydrogenase (short-subunit alcohol dehydrogenase family)
MKTTAPGNRIWFITGASPGLGAEIAKAALAAGETVVGTGRRVEEVNRASFARISPAVNPSCGLSA